MKGQLDEPIVMVKIMNEVILLGRISSDVKATYKTKGNDVSCVLGFNLAVTDRASKKDSEGNYETDFFRITSFGAIAECIERYCSKGDKVIVRGKLKNNNYTKEDGSTSYGTEIILSEIEFIETKRKDDAKSSKK